MNLNLTINKTWLLKVKSIFTRQDAGFWVVVLAGFMALGATLYNFFNDYIVLYGDAESHLNISKRVIDSITPGFAQLGGIWLPIPHLLMVPFVSVDYLWRTGLAGSIVSGIAFIVAALFIYKTVFLITKNKAASFIAALVLIFNPNILYLQSTPMTEVLLIVFFALSSFYFIRFMLRQQQITSLLLASFFGFLSVLTRYDGWFLVALEASIIFMFYFPWSEIKSPRQLWAFFKTETWKKSQGYIVLFSTLAFFGILIWLGWDFLILGDPLFFTHSEFSAKSQQNSWLARGELPAYHNMPIAFLYYLVTALGNAGILMFILALVGLVYYLSDRKQKYRWLISLLLAAPFIFNVLTQFMGQSVIFIPSLTPSHFEWHLFNVRYGVMTVPLIAVLVGYLFYRVRTAGKALIMGLILLQVALYQVGYSQVISWKDGTVGLSSAKRPDAEKWLNVNYDTGLVLMDDYARTVSVVRSGMPMENMIYIGNKPYWEESLGEPEKYATWIVMQQDDAVWNSLWEKPEMQGRLYKYFEKVYTSPETLIFRKPKVAPVQNSIWLNQCVDTMKFSRDAARELVNSPNLNSFLEIEMNLVRDIGATCVAIGTPYDEEFVPYLTAWVNKAREKGLKVWFRGNMSGWEGWFDYPEFTSADQHTAGIRNLITKHPELFREGDIFTPASEPENGILGDPRDSVQNKARFISFLPQSYANCVDSFAEIKISVICGYYSVNGDVAKQIFDKDLVSKIGGVVSIDHYVADPKQLVADIKYLKDKLGYPVMLGEIGAPIPDIQGTFTEQDQADYIYDVMDQLYQEKDLIIGLNYWVLRGGSTALVNDDSHPRLAYYSLKSYFTPGEVSGIVADSLGRPLQGVRIVSENPNLETFTDAKGVYKLVAPSRGVSVAVEDKAYVGGNRFETMVETGKRVTHDFVLEPARKTLWYKFRVWLKTIHF